MMLVQGRCGIDEDYHHNSKLDTESDFHSHCRDVQQFRIRVAM
jgi:hypothetical protein